MDIALVIQMTRLFTMDTALVIQLEFCYAKINLIKKSIKYPIYNIYALSLKYPTCNIYNAISLDNVKKCDECMYR